VNTSIKNNYLNIRDRRKQMKKQTMLLISLIVSVFLLSACGINAAAPLETIPAPAGDLIVAEGHFVPQENMTLSFPVRGKISGILVKQGDKVKEGQVLINLGDNYQAEAAMAAAVLELTSANQSVDVLYRTADLAKAQALTAYINSQKTRLASQLVYDRLDLNAIQTGIEDAQKEVDTRQTNLEKAQKDFDKYKDLAADNADHKTYEDKLSKAQINYDDALQLLLVQTSRLDEPKAALDTALGAEAQAKHTYENSAQGPDIEKLALAQARLDNASAQVSAARNALDSYELKAPLDGTVADINVFPNQQVGPETWAIVLIDDRQWYVDTSDLTEYDVVSIKAGQTADITIDALPEIKMTGVLEEIANSPKVLAGDVTYTARLRIDNPDSRIKWGMTAEVTFPVKK
jgi:multidrug resistance efflux pump